MTETSSITEEKGLVEKVWETLESGVGADDALRSTQVKREEDTMGGGGRQCSN